MGKLDKNLVGFGREKSGHHKFSSQNNLRGMLDSDSDSADEEETKLEGRQVVVSRPVAVHFPRFTSQITQIACGVAHMLALSADGQMFSWG